MDIIRGDILLADLSPVKGSEQGGTRPVLVLQNDKGNKYSSTVIVAPITKKIYKTNLPTHVKISNKNGISRNSIALMEQLRTIDKIRASRVIGHVDDETMKKVDNAIIVSLGLRKLQASDIDCESMSINDSNRTKFTDKTRTPQLKKGLLDFVNNTLEKFGFKSKNEIKIKEVENFNSNEQVLSNLDELNAKECEKSDFKDEIDKLREEVNQEVRQAIDNALKSDYNSKKSQINMAKKTNRPEDKITIQTRKKVVNQNSVDEQQNTVQNTRRKTNSKSRFKTKNKTDNEKANIIQSEKNNIIEETDKQKKSKKKYWHKKKKNNIRENASKETAIHSNGQNIEGKTQNLNKINKKQKNKKFYKFKNKTPNNNNRRVKRGKDEVQ